MGLPHFLISLIHFEIFEKGVIMLRQITNGKTTNTVMVNGSVADLTTLASILVGQVEVYDLQGTGGTTAMGIELNPYSFSVGKRHIDGSYESASVRLPHMKPTKSIKDVRSAVVGAFDASFETSSKCEYANGLYNKA